MVTCWNISTFSSRGVDIIMKWVKTLRCGFRRKQSKTIYTFISNKYLISLFHKEVSQHWFLNFKNLIFSVLGRPRRMLIMNIITIILFYLLLFCVCVFLRLWLPCPHHRDVMLRNGFLLSFYSIFNDEIFWNFMPV